MNGFFDPVHQSIIRINFLSKDIFLMTEPFNFNLGTLNARKASGL
jgi:hypothetical protein